MNVSLEIKKPVHARHQWTVKREEGCVELINRAQAPCLPPTEETFAALRLKGTEEGCHSMLSGDAKYGVWICAGTCV